MRICKYISHTGYCSRREAERHIVEKNISINGQIVVSPTTLVSEGDIVRIKNVIVETVENNDTKVVEFYKPRQIITSTNDENNRTTIFDILPKSFQNMCYVGRLDYNTEGLLLLTNNKRYAHFLASPKNQIKRIYKIKCFGNLSNNFIPALKAGIKFDGIKYNPINAKILFSENKQNILEFTLNEGKNREIRNVMGIFDLKIKQIIRIQYGDFSIDGLQSGKFRFAKNQDIAKTIKSIN